MERKSSDSFVKSVARMVMLLVMKEYGIELKKADAAWLKKMQKLMKSMG